MGRILHGLQPGRNIRRESAQPVRILHVSAGGVHSAGVKVARVQLRFADSVVLEDDTDEASVLFITDPQVRGATERASRERRP